MNKLKVIFITTVYNEVENGPGIYANYLWDNFYKSTNVEFHLIAPDIVKQNEHLHSVNSYKSSRSLYTTIQQKALELANKLSGNVIIHVNSAHYAWLLKKHRGPVIVQINDYDVVDIYREIFSTFKQDGMRRILSLIWRRRMESIAVKNATIVVCNSEYTYTRVIDGYNLSPDKAVIVYKAVDIDYFNKITNTNLTQDSQTNNHCKLVFVGSHWERKGLDILFRALHLLNNEYPNQYQLAVAGPIQYHNNYKLVQLAEALGISKHIKYLGNVSRNKIPILFNESDIFILPSRREALGVSILEAMAVGIPVIASNVGGITEIIDNGKYGVLVSSENPEQLASEISIMNNNKAKAKIFSEAGKIRAMDYSHDKMISNIYSMYIRATNNCSPHLEDK